MKERIQKILSERGIASRRAAEAMMLDGRVAVNGEPALPGDTADPETDTITVDGELLPPAGRMIYIMLNKPRGYVTTVSDEKGRKTVMDLVRDAGGRIYPVGRLDIASEGLLIMTNDGEFANRIMHPSFGKEKTYRVSVAGDIKRGAQALSAEIDIGGETVKAKKVDIITASEDTAVIDITIGEGKNREIRRMCAAAGLDVKRLCRRSIGSVELGSLKPGKWRALTKEEISSLTRG